MIEKGWIMKNTIKDKVVLITGASEGIGRELSYQFASQQVKLVLASRNLEALEHLTQECLQKGAETISVKTDVSSSEDCKRMIDLAIGKFGKIDILIQCAGISMSAPFESVQDLGIFEKLMSVNYLGIVYSSYYALSHLKKTKGLIVNISSLQGKTGFPGSTGYSASKFAVQGFSDSLRIELKDTGVDVLVVSPGPIATQMNFRKFDANGTISKEKQQTPKKNIMSVSTCARLILDAIVRRDRELVMTFGGKLIPWVKLVAPRFVDRLVANAVEKFYAEV
ncbi:SDR family oxidoreductase [Leptospira adleri]|nr:SDR family oxidoreductase [Leptospira adleri]